MIDIDAFVSRVIEQGAGFATVRAAYSMDPLDNVQHETPALYAWVGSETAGDNEADGNVVDQQVQHVVSCYVVCEYHRLAEIRASLRAAICGWQPDEDHNPFAFAGGAVTKIDGATYWWRDDFYTHTNYQS